MKLRLMFPVVMSVVLLSAGCGDDGGGGSKEEAREKEPKTKAEKAVAVDRENKEKQVEQAKKTFEKKDDDLNACRNLAMSYVALASPASTGDPKNPPKPPKDRDENMKKAIATLERCRKIDPDDRDVKQMLASSYMGTNQYDKAADLLEDLAKSARGQERANAYYAWGLAASNAQRLDEAIAAWRQFVQLAPPKDERVPQIRQSIKALEAAQKQQPAGAEKAGDAEAGDDAAEKG